MTPEEQEIVDILADRIYVVVEYDDSEARDYLRYADLTKMTVDEIDLMVNLKIISDRLTWNDALCFRLRRNKCFIADYRDYKHPSKYDP